MFNYTYYIEAVKPILSTISTVNWDKNLLAMFSNSLFYLVLEFGTICEFFVDGAFSTGNFTLSFLCCILLLLRSCASFLIGRTYDLMYLYD